MIKRAGFEDSPVLAQLALKVWDDALLADLTHEFEVMSQGDHCASFIKYVNDQPVGFANVSLRVDYVEGCETSPVGYLEGLYVEHQYRHNGYATELMKVCEQWAWEQGCQEFASDCLLTNEESLAFHLSCGFQEANRLICFHKKLQDSLVEDDTDRS